MDKIHFILPSFELSDALKATLFSISRIPSNRRGTVVVMVPAARMKEAPDFISDGCFDLDISIIQESSPGVYPAFNDGLEKLRGKGGYVVFLGAGDILHSPSSAILNAMDRGVEFICMPVGDRPSEFKAVNFFGRWVVSLPNHQGCMYRLSMGRVLDYKKEFRIYDDVLQRLDVLKSHGHCIVSGESLISVDDWGVSGVQSWAKVAMHVNERMRLFLPILGRGEPVLAFKYLFGSFAVFFRYAFSVKNRV